MRKNKNSASEINERLVQNSNPTEQIILSSANEKQKLTFQNDEILYLEAMQNYTAIIFIRDDKLQKEMIRNTFSAIEKQLFDTSIIRCHRSYFINLNQIDKIEGNAQCLNIFLKEQDDLTVPVSKKYMKAFSSKIK